MLRILALAEAHGVPVTGAGGFEAANLPAMAGHLQGGMLEVHGAHAAPARAAKANSRWPPWCGWPWMEF